jgi:hypothetical protein
MKKIIIILLTIILCACSLTNSPSLKVKEYLDNFNNLDENVIEDMESAIIKENLSSSNTSIYREVLTKQYKDLKYEIVDEKINDDKSEVKVKVTVYDLYNSRVESENYMNENQSEFFNEENIFDEEKYMKYRLDEMLKTKNTITHDITFNLTKINDEWKIDNIDREALEKIHGLYDYNLD